MLVREGNKINIVKKRKNEALRGLIGNVNATAKDNAPVIKALKQDNLLYDMKFNDNDETFTVVMYFVYDGDLYKIVIDDQGKDKIVASLYKGENRCIKKVKGIKLFMGSIRDAVKSLIKDLCDGDFDKIESPSKAKEKREFLAKIEKEKERFREREREIEREREKARKEWEKEQERERERNKEKERERNREYSRDLDFIGKHSSVKDYDYGGNDYSYSRIDMDPYGSAWI